MTVYDNVIEVAFTLSLIVNALAYVPQFLKLLRVKDAKELSSVTFIGFLLIQISIVLHAIIVKDYLLFYGTLASITTCAAVVWLIVYYHFKNRNRSATPLEPASSV